MRLSLHSIGYSGSWGQSSLTLEAFIERAASLGFEGVMLAAKRPHASPLDLDSAGRRKIKDLLERHGLRLDCLAGYTNFTADAEHPEIPQIEMQIGYVEELCRLAVALGGKIVRVFTGYEHPALPHSRAWDRTAAALKEAARRAGDMGATLALQNHHDLGGHWRSFQSFLETVNEPNLRAAFDAWAPALQGDNLAEAASAMAKWTVHTTVADYARMPRFRYRNDLVNYHREDDYIQAVPMGTGFIDYRGFLDGLRKGGYTGAVAYEMCSPLLPGGGLETLDKFAREFRDFTRAWRAGESKPAK